VPEPNEKSNNTQGPGGRSEDGERVVAVEEKGADPTHDSQAQPNDLTTTPGENGRSALVVGFEIRLLQLVCKDVPPGD
jgi:predicted FMN-binding regulatory protein PaiB